MAELEPPTGNASEAADAKGGAGRSKDEVALELMKFIAIQAGYGKPMATGAGFSAKAATRSPEEVAEELLGLFDRCRKAISA
ncbi:MAG: hypothetical protein ABI759_22660 [Candidatus Solibacter sp.]